jgi:F-type H+-transporting ATPase subunit alpha
MKKVTGKLRLQLAQFRELQAFVQFASDVDEATKKRIRQGQLATEILKQNDLAPMPFEEQAVVFYAVLNGHFDEFEAEVFRSTEEKYLEFMRQFHNDEVLKPIRESGDISKETEEKLKIAITHFVSQESPQPKT